MKKVLDFSLSIVYLVYFSIILIIFHVIQFFCYEVLGKKAHKVAVDVLNFFIVYGWLLTGSTVQFGKKFFIPTDRRPIIFIANHQSMFDIPGMVWFLRKFTPVFVSKVELARGIPSISYNLRKSGAALINRSEGRSAILEISRLGKYINDNRFSAVIFPEGSRSPNGEMKPFILGGVATLLKRVNNPIVVPVAIQGTGKFNPKGIFPLTSFTKMTWNTLEVIEVADKTPKEILDLAEESIRNFINSN